MVTEYWIYGEFGEGFGMPKMLSLQQKQLTTFSVDAKQAGQKTLDGIGQT